MTISALIIALSGVFLPVFGPSAAIADDEPAPIKTAASNPDLWTNGVEVDHVDASIIHFKPVGGGNGKAARLPGPLDTKLFDIKYLGPLSPTTEGGLPYLLMAAKPCGECNEERQIYAVRVDGARSTHFVYPGKILDPKSRALLFESRAFYGKCLPKQGDAYVVYQRERLDRKRAMQPSVFTASVGKDFLNERMIERHPPNIKHTLPLVKKKLCSEIVGRNRLMLRKRMSLTPRREKEKEDDDDDSADEAPTKENQTDKDLQPPAAE